MKDVSIDPIQHVNELVEKGMKALEVFETLTQEQVNHIVAKAAVAGIDQHGALALMAANETGRGVFEDKAIKNLYACEYVLDYMRDLKTVGVINEDPLNGIQEIACPVGVICGLTPTTNPTSTTFFKALISLKTRNPIIFAFHPSAQQCSSAAAKVIYDAAVEAGAPKDCIQWIEYPSMEATNGLMNHPNIATILATGGNAMVKAAYSCGKPALGVGAGNVPAYIEKTANLDQAVNDVVLSKAFDNGMICASEQAVIIDKEIYQDAIKKFEKHRVYFVNKKEKGLLEKYMFGVEANSKDVDQARLNTAVVGKPASWIASQAGFNVPVGTIILAAECKEVGPNEPLTREKLSPVLAVLKSNTTNEGIDLAKQMVRFHGLGHSAAIHTSNKELATRFGETIEAIRIIWNAPSSHGAIGGLYNALMPSLTLGCGSYGKNSVSNNVGAVNLINVKRVARRNNNMQWFKVPQKIYFEANSIRYLSTMANVSRVMIVTDKGMNQLGYVQKIIDVLNRRQTPVMIEIFDQVEPDPSIQTVDAGTSVMLDFKPDTIIALGGGSPMDAAKVMWLKYEHPEVNFDDLKQKFIDIRKRSIKYPELGNKASLVCIPTTSGTGSEVTPFAVISDPTVNKKYPLADYALTPSVAIIDAELAKSLPSHIAADTGMDVLTHAIESYVSVLASDFTDGLALQAIRLVFDYLPRSVQNGASDFEAKEKMHNAATIAGMAFGNAFLGINHSLAHKIGGLFHVPHGRANAILLPYVIMYNGTQPSKLSTWPKYTHYQADQKYQQVARTLGLDASSSEAGVKALAKATYELSKALNIPTSFKETGLDRDEFMSQLEFLAFNAYEDQCSPANPRQPLVEDLKQILIDAYEGKTF